MINIQSARMESGDRCEIRGQGKLCLIARGSQRWFCRCVYLGNVHDQGLHDDRADADILMPTHRWMLICIACILSYFMVLAVDAWNNDAWTILLFNDYWLPIICLTAFNFISIMKKSDYLGVFALTRVC